MLKERGSPSLRRSSSTGRWLRCGLSWGIEPAALLGYSVGEYVAAVLSGVLRLDDALEIVANRAAWIQDKAEPGVMLAVPLAEPDLRPLLGSDLWFAAINSPQATVVGGREASIQRLEEELKGMEMVDAPGGLGARVAYAAARPGAK